MNEFREVIQKVSRGQKLAKDLTREESAQALRWIFDGGASEFQTGAFFAAMRMKGESSQETAGLVEAVRERATQLHSNIEGILDIGEPYDGKVKTLHITVPVALILAAAGVPVVLHSTPETPVKKGVEIQGILETLGVEIVEEARRLREILDDEKITFLPTEKLAPDFAKLRPFREAFGLRPFANHIEKIFNLANAAAQMVGVYHRPYLEPMGEALALLGTRCAFVIQGVEGFTELYLSRKTLVLQVKEGKALSFWLDPAEFGFSARGGPAFGGSGRGEEEPAVRWTAQKHAGRILDLLQGAPGQGRESILWNAGVKLFWMNKTESVEAGLRMARQILDSGKALDQLAGFRNATHEKTHTQTI